MVNPLDDIQSDYWQPSLTGDGVVVEGVDEINQCIEIILRTPKGSDPHRPNFASNVLEVIDRPQTQIGPLLISEVYQAIETWEPRIDLVSFDFEFNKDNQLGKVDLYLTWRLKAGGVNNQTVVTV